MIIINSSILSSKGRQDDKSLGIATIANIGGDRVEGDYQFVIDGKLYFVYGFKRLKKSHWDLLFLCLLEAVGENNKKQIKEFLKNET